MPGHDTRSAVQTPTADDLISQGQAAEREGQRDVARSRYAAAQEQLGHEPSPTLASLNRWIGRTHLDDGRLDVAEEHFRTALQLSDQLRDLAGIAHALNLTAILQQHRGNLDEAERLYRQARQYANEADDPRLLALIDMNLGIVSNIRGDLNTALSHYQTSLAGFRSIDAVEHVEHVLNNLGMLYTDLARWSEAEAAYEEALQSCLATSHTGTQIIVEVNRAELWIAQKQYSRALASCDAAKSLAEATGDFRQMGELLKHYGVVYREMEDLRAAEYNLLRARAIASEREDLLLCAEIAREQAELYWRQQRSQETLQSLNDAHRFFAQLRARRDLAEIDRRMGNLEEMFLEIVHRWSQSIESKDEYTQGHCIRVADSACALARAVGFDDQTLLWFRMGALLHDVGKIVVPTEILNKPGVFTPEERRIMESHPDAGVELLKDINFPWDIRPMVRHHHEWWNGGGYPAKLSRYDIPLAARILCIADVYDALATDRPYRKAYSPERALEIMEADVGRIFDPELFPIFRKLLGERTDSDRQRVYFPLPVSDDQGPAAKAAGHALRGPIRVLLVEDCAPDASLKGTAEGLREKNALELEHVRRLDDALRRLSEDQFDAVLLDLILPDSRGIGTLARLHTQAPDVPVVIVTGLDDESIALQAMQAGAQDYLVKGQADRNLLIRSIRYAIERHRLQSELRTMSLVDELTGLYNRRGFFTLAQQQLKIADRTKRGLVLLFADLDGLKEINDTLGHRMGDLALIDTARVLTDTFRDSDTIARMGGDEFVVLAIETTASEAGFLLNRVRDGFNAFNASAERAYHLSVSIGIAAYQPEYPCSIDDLLSRADTLMYERKRKRKIR